MILFLFANVLWFIAFPRTSGDDPILVMFDYAGNIFSPHERG